MSISEKQERLDDVVAEMETLANADLDDSGRRKFDALEALAKKLNSDIERLAKVDFYQHESRKTVVKAPTPRLVRGDYDAPSWSTRTDTGGEYRKLFRGVDLSDDGGFKTLGGFLSAIASGRQDPRLDQRAATGAISSDGGYSIPSAHLGALADEIFGQSVILNELGVRKVPMTARECEFWAWDSDTRVGGVGPGGLQAFWTQEGSAASEADVDLRALSLHARRLSVYCNASRELLEDSPDFERELVGALGRTIAAAIDKELVNGNGSARPKGILQSASLISVAKQTDQESASIMWENCCDIYARMMPQAQRRCKWLASSTTIPQLMTMGLTIGAAGEWYPAMREDSGRFYIMGLPVVFVDACPTVGNVGDLTLVDPNAYCFGLLGDSLRISTSDHFKFDRYSRSFMASVRCDGLSVYDSTIVGADGISVAPFVNILERA